MEKKFTVLRVIATLYKIAGVLIALGTILIVILVILGGAATSEYLYEFSGVESSPIFIFLAVLFTFIGGALSALSVYAIGEALSLLIGLEENTRFTAILLRDRFYPQAQARPAPMPPQPVIPPQPMTPPPPPANPTYPQS